MSVPTAADGTGHPDLQAAFASTLVDEWTRGGVGHAVVCPGSRSTPLGPGAGRPPGHGRPRPPGRALGRASPPSGSGGRPGARPWCSPPAARRRPSSMPRWSRPTSGAVPLIVCTADRPPELRDVGAPQTIDQTHLFGGSVRWFCDPGVADPAARGHVAVPRRPLGGRGRVGRERARSRPPQPALPGAAPRRSGRRRRSGPGTAGRATLAPGGPGAAGPSARRRCAPWSSPAVSTGGGAGSSWPGPAVAIPTPCSGWPTPWAGRSWPNRARDCASPGRV